MDQHQARKLVRETLENSFNEGNFEKLIANLLNHFEDAPFSRTGNYIPDAFENHISKYERIAKYSNGDDRVDVLVVHLKKTTSIERARTMQRNFVAGYLNGKYGSDTYKDAALVAFISPNGEDWRFSLVKREYELEKKEDRFSPARRWSFLVGKNEKSHTAQTQLENIVADDVNDPTLLQLEEAFGIEKVTKEFFEKYRALFMRTKNELDKVLRKNAEVRAEFNDKNINTVDFAKKLLGQIVFLYFLQKKGWFGVSKDKNWGDGSKQFLRELFDKKHIKYSCFFNDVLEPLFYDALAIDHSHLDHWSEHFKSRIPFLNGGLFDPIGSYRWDKTDIALPDALFSNNHETEDGDTGDGILDIFDRFNFTVNEDEPMEKEVAIDPEMLGKIFEKLGAITPEKYDEWAEAVQSGNKKKEMEANKKLGVYYTPREIVHYMCQQSLICYLDTELNTQSRSYEKLGDPQLDMLGNESKKGQLDLEIEHRGGADVPKKDIETLILHGELFIEHEEEVARKGKETKTYSFEIPESIRKNAKRIDDKLAQIRICDPAIGSGAFPMGMMSEIVKARSVLTHYLNSPSQAKGCPDSESGRVETPRPALQDTPLCKEGNERTPYNFKRDCIEHSLYGVDIDAGAVEIAKLRFWLSMVVDEENFEVIRPLPNLDYKVVCGNSLLGIQQNILNQPLFLELEQLKHLFFDETNATKKKELKKKIDALIDKITDGKKIFDFEVYFSEVFHEKKGFDVVIGNPPYIKEYINRKAFDGLRDSPCYQGKMDIWYLFACGGIDKLKGNGVLAFIAQNNWVTNYGASKMREKIISDAIIISLLDFNDFKVFENSDIQTMVMLFKKNGNNENYIFDCRRVVGKNTNINDILDMLNYRHNSLIEYLQPPIIKNNSRGLKLTFNESKKEKLLEKIEHMANFSLDPKEEVAQGIVSPQDFVNSESQAILGKNFKIGDGIFVLTESEKNSLSLSKTELELIRPYYTTSELGKYFANIRNNYWIIYTDSSFKNPSRIKPYPNLKKHLDQFKNVITSDNRPYGLHRSRDEKFFNGMKIMSLRKCSEPTFSYTEFDCYVSQTFNIIKTDRLDLKYLTAILNSKLIAFWLQHKGKKQGNLFQIDKEPLLAIPLFSALSKEQKPIIKLIDRILSAKAKDPDADTGAQEDEIDVMVYKLYELTYDEVLVVEPGFGEKMSKKEYEGYEIK